MQTVQRVEVEVTDAKKARQERMKLRPGLNEILNLHDFEVRLLSVFLWGVALMRCKGYREIGYV